MPTSIKTEPRLFDDIYQRPEEIRFWLGQNPGRAFLRSLKEWQKEHEATLKKSEDSIRMYRAQGAIEVLERILQLKEELEGIVKGDSNGKN